MSISVNSVLDAGLLVHGKFPDIFWNMDLTGSELKVLRYVYNNCLRLYKDLKIYPKGKDGSPRYWRGKEKMAEDCGVSYVTFRKNVRHLAELGLITPMDGLEDEDELYCIGLSSQFIENTVNSSSVKNFRLHFLYDLVKYLYDSLTLEIDVDNLENIPCITHVIQLDEPSSIGDSSISEKISEHSNSSKQQKIKRSPIRMGRSPIITTPEILRQQTYSQKLKLLKGVRTPHEKRVFEIADYYEYKCRKALHSTGFKSLGKDAKNHKNWKYYERIIELCNEKGWDYKVYIDSQFDRVNYWQHKQVYPYLNQMFSENAQKYYANYMKNFKESNSVTGTVEAQSEEIKSTHSIIIDKVIQDCEGISGYIEKAQKRRANRGLTLEQLKILYLSDHWMGLSDYYLASIPWFVGYLSSFPDEPYVVNLRENIQAIQKSKSLFKTTIEIVENVENQMTIPKTLCM